MMRTCYENLIIRMDEDKRKRKRERRQNKSTIKN